MDAQLVSGWIDFFVASALLAVLLAPGYFWFRGHTPLLRVAWGVPLSILTIATLALFYSALGIPYSLLSVGLALFAFAGLGFSISGRSRRFRGSDAGLPVRYLGFGWLIAAVINSVSFAFGVRNPVTEFPQNWDAMFHLSAIRWILDSQNGSALHLGGAASTLSASDVYEAGPYPAAFHDLAALVSLGGNPVLGTNVVAFFSACLLFALGCGLLALMVIPNSRWAVFLAPIFSAGFSSFPDFLTEYGILWPLLLSYCLVPFFLAALVDALGRGHAAPLSFETLLLSAAFALVIAMAHPQGLFVILAPLTLLTGDAVLRTLTGRLRLSRLRQFLLGLTALVVVAIFVALNFFHVAQRYEKWSYRERFSSLASATLGTLLDYHPQHSVPENLIPKWVLAALIVVGAGFALRRIRYFWVLGSALMYSWLVFIVLYPLARGYWLTAPWYYDPPRVLAITPIYFTLLAAFGAHIVFAFLGQRFSDRDSLRVGLESVLAGALVLATAVVDIPSAVSWYRLTYQYRDMTGPSSLLSEQERQLIMDAPLDPRKMVIGDPRAGETLPYALRGQPVAFRHMTGPIGPEFSYLWHNLKSYPDDQLLCRLLQKYDVGYFYSDSILYALGDPDDPLFAGLVLTEEQLQKLPVVAKSDHAVIYELPSCVRGN